MFPEIRTLSNTTPFVPFTIHTADGRAIRVPTVDHVALPPAGGRVFVFGDKAGEYEVLSPLLIAHLSVESGAPAASTGA